MNLTKLTTDIEYHQKQVDEPNDAGGLTAEQFKLLCDQAAIDIKNYINDTLTIEIDSVIEILKGVGWTNENLKGLKDALETHKDSGDHDEMYYTKTQSDSSFATKGEVYSVTLGQIPNGSITDDKLSNAAGQIKSSFASFINTQNLKTYTSATQLGLVNSTATIESIIQAMPSNSCFICDITGYNAIITQVPSGYGTLIIDRVTAGRTRIMFNTSNNGQNSNINEDIYYCNYNSTTGFISAWARLITDTCDPIVQYNGKKHYLKADAEGLYLQEV